MLIAYRRDANLLALLDYLLVSYQYPTLYGLGFIRSAGNTLLGTQGKYEPSKI